MSRRPQDRYAVARPSVTFPDEPLSAELPVILPAGCRWGVALSHDVDHLSLAEHVTDGQLVRIVGNAFRKHLIRRFAPGAALAAASRGLGVLAGRDPWAVAIDDLLAAERRAGVTSSWFFAVRPGLGIRYSLAAATPFVRRVLAAGHEVGLHGQHPDDEARLAAEILELAELCGRSIGGIRMHYLRLSPAVYDAAQRCGLAYDSTVMDRSHLDPAHLPLAGPRLVRPGLVEIPLHVMDSTLFSSTGLALDEREAVDYLQRLVARAREAGRVLVVNLHPNFYSRFTPEIRGWYDALLGLVTGSSDAFLTTLEGLRQRIVLP
ncbi:MAG: hypothetical protein MUF27_02755 [Acidobacteria bacterium]|jgi:peptidoglycan/xylan/chitin deacetylase (PgdA/CDA1 family)|nr:hypothetical protein [Acidobacteriota bacterium]